MAVNRDLRNRVAALERDHFVRKSEADVGHGPVSNIGTSNLLKIKVGLDAAGVRLIIEPMADDSLFFKYDLRKVIDNQRGLLKRELDGMPDSRLLNTDLSELQAYAVQKYGIVLPVLGCVFKPTRRALSDQDLASDKSLMDGTRRQRFGPVGNRHLPCGVIIPLERSRVHLDRSAFGPRIGRCMP